MSCFGCSRKYGLFCKEYGCPNCGYSYCAKCLKRPVAVPKHSNKVMNVCVICFDKLSKIIHPEKVLDIDALPGSILTKSTSKPLNKEQAAKTDINSLLEVDPASALVGEPILKPISPNKMSTSMEIIEENPDIIENLDTAILNRLKKLKSDRNTATTDDEIRSRLANLNGMPQKDYSKKDILLNTDERSDQEKMNDLLKQFMGEAHLDRRVEDDRNDAISDIERRLRALRDAPVDVDIANRRNNLASPDTNTPSDNEEEDDETVLKNIMQKYLAEARLPEAPTELENELMATLPKPPEGVDTEELPWCNICNEDAVYRCKGCDGELFCMQCFRECHDDDEEYRAHIKESYSAPPKFKEDHF